MIQEAIYFWMSAMTVMFAIIGIVYIGMYRRYERESLVSGMNFVMLGLIAIIAVAVINMLQFASISYSRTLLALLPGARSIVPVFLGVKNLALYPLIAVLFFLSAVLYRK